MKRTRTIKRKPEDERWSARKLELIVGVPWRPEALGEEREEGDSVPLIRVEPREPQVRVEAPLAAEPVPRRLYIRSKDIERCACPTDCKGCMASIKGGRVQTHSDACRDCIWRRCD